MSRSVVFRTPGKLDLRSLTIFGLNAKPSVTNPIGYFGTGLKYAIAVLMRERIPVTIFVGPTKWVIEVEETKFRDKDFASIVLTRHRKFLPPQKRVLPFTTELGKNWDLWQAYRELESNTLDEQGETYITRRAYGDLEGSINDEDCPHTNEDRKNFTDFTYIQVESEDFVQEHLDREKTFLPRALRQQIDGDASVQVFQQPSKFLYYRGIRVMELEAPSNQTYNILKQIRLTEDRTVESKYEVQWLLERYLAQKAPTHEIKKAVTAPKDSWETRNLSFERSYISDVIPSETFREAVKTFPKAEVMKEARAYVDSFEPPKPKPILEPWIDELINLLGQDPPTDNDLLVGRLIMDHHKRLVEILKQAERIEEPKPFASMSLRPIHTIDNDEIPF